MFILLPSSLFLFWFFLYLLYILPYFICVSIYICWVALFYFIGLSPMHCTASKSSCNQNTAINPIPWFILANINIIEGFLLRLFIWVWFGKTMLSKPNGTSRNLPLFEISVWPWFCQEVGGLSTLDRLEVIILIVEVRWSSLPFQHHTTRNTAEIKNNF